MAERFPLRPVFFRRGFTLIELLVVVAIILILAGLLAPNFESILNRAEKVVCTSHLRTLWTAFSKRLADGEDWPQVPPNIVIGSVEEQRWWVAMASNSMGLPAKIWTCPTITRRAKNVDQNGPSATIICYLPTLFGKNPSTPMKWSQMPWFTEVSNAHGEGNLMVRTDGAVVPFSTNAPTAVVTP